MKSCLIMEGVNDGRAQLSHMQLLFIQQDSAREGLPNRMAKTKERDKHLDKPKMIIHSTFILHIKTVYQVEPIDCQIQM